MNTFFLQLKIIRYFLGYAWQASPFYLILHFVTNILAEQFSIVSAFIFKLVIDKLIANFSSGEQSDLYLWAVLLACSFAGSGILYTIMRFAETRVKDNLQPHIDKIFFAKLNRLPYSDFEDSKTYDIIEKITDNISWRPAELVWQMPTIIAALIKIVITGLLISQIGLWAVPLVLISLIPRFFIDNYLTKSSYIISDSRVPESRRYGYMSWLLADRTAQAELRVFKANNRVESKIANLLDTFKKQNMGLSRISFLLGIFDYSGRIVIMLTIVIRIFKKTANNLSSIGDLSFAINNIQDFTNSAEYVFYNIARIRDHTTYLKDWNTFINLPEENRTGKQLTQSFKTIKFENVFFSYPGQKTEVLKNINLTINAHDKMALIGVNGSGKSTLVKLLMRFYKPTSGKILVDGVDLQEISIDAWYDQLTILLQNFVQYQETVRENIYLGSPINKSDDAYEQAKKKADVVNLIAGLAGKDDQMLGRKFEGGVDLSGGNWQKLALARMYYADAPLMILDEPTAAIDAIAEEEIFEQLLGASDNKTLILISHRFATVRKTQRIVVLENGEVIEQGSHEELLAKQGKYAEMFTKQAKGYEG